MGQKRVISGSDLDYFMGQRVIRVSEVEAVATLIYTYTKQCHPHMGLSHTRMGQSHMRMHKVDLAFFI